MEERMKWKKIIGRLGMIAVRIDCRRRLPLLAFAIALVGCRPTSVYLCKEWEQEQLVTKCEAKAPDTSDVFADSVWFSIPNSPLAKGELVSYGSDEAFARGADIHAKTRNDKSFGPPLVDARNAKARRQLLVLGATVDAVAADTIWRRVEALK